MAIDSNIALQGLSTRNPGFATQLINDTLATMDTLQNSQNTRSYRDQLRESAKFDLKEAMETSDRNNKARSLLSELLGGQSGQIAAFNPEMARFGQTFQQTEKMNPLELRGKEISNQSGVAGIGLTKAQTSNTYDSMRSRKYNDNLQGRADARAAQNLSISMADRRQQIAQQQQQAAQQQQMTMLNQVAKAAEIVSSNPEQYTQLKPMIEQRFGIQMPESVEEGIAFAQQQGQQAQAQLSLMTAGQPQKLTAIDPDKRYIDQTGNTVFEPVTAAGSQRISSDFVLGDIEITDSEAKDLRKQFSGLDSAVSIATDMRNSIAQQGGSSPLTVDGARIKSQEKLLQNTLKEAFGMGALQEAEIRQMQAMIPDTVGFGKNVANISKDKWLASMDSMVEGLEQIKATRAANAGLQRSNSSAGGGTTGGSNSVKDASDAELLGVLGL